MLYKQMERQNINKKKHTNTYNFTLQQINRIIKFNSLKTVNTCALL